MGRIPFTGISRAGVVASVRGAGRVAKERLDGRNDGVGMGLMGAVQDIVEGKKLAAGQPGRNALPDHERDRRILAPPDQQDRLMDVAEAVPQGHEIEIGQDTGGRDAVGGIGRGSIVPDP